MTTAQRPAADPAAVAHLTAKAQVYYVPRSLVPGLVGYAVDRCPVGSFLTAVLENNLVEAVLRADNVNRLKLREIVGFISDELPSACWGSPTKVDAWLTGKGA